MSVEMEKVGFIGLGNIGTPMVLSLLRAGRQVVVRDLRREAAQEVIAAGATFADSFADMTRECDLIGVAVVNDSQVRGLLLGENGLLAAMQPGQLVVLHSTIMPATVLDMAAEAANCGIRLVDAPISGGDQRARQGDLAIMVGGATEDVARCNPYLAQMARCVEHMGDLGSGAGTKLAMQMMSLGNWVIAMECMRLGRALGLDEQRMARVATQTTADSWVVQTWGNYDRVLREHQLSGEPLYRFFDKDLFNAVALGRELNVTLPSTAAASQALGLLAAERLAADH